MAEPLQSTPVADVLLRERSCNALKRNSFLKEGDSAYQVIGASLFWDDTDLDRVMAFCASIILLAVFNCGSNVTCLLHMRRRRVLELIEEELDRVGPDLSLEVGYNLCVEAMRLLALFPLIADEVQVFSGVTLSIKSKMLLERVVKVATMLRVLEVTVKSDTPPASWSLARHSRMREES